MARPVLMVVDDDDDMRMITRKTVERTPYGETFQVVEADSASAAEASFERHQERGDVVHMICDHGLPDGSGVDLFARLVERDLGLQERFLLITSSLWTVDDSAATAAGVEHVAEKPFGVQAWLELLGGWIERWGAALPAGHAARADHMARKGGGGPTARP